MWSSEAEAEGDLPSPLRRCGWGEARAAMIDMLSGAAYCVNLPGLAELPARRPRRNGNASLSATRPGAAQRGTLR